MAIQAGTRLGPYEVLSLIGAGGMGEVYRAHDRKLGRDVAVKVLPGAFAHDMDRLARFEREAKLLAALSHPNIATIYGLEEVNGEHYLVMELVAGKSLADRIRREGALPVREALSIARQIAEALEAAHEKSIIHRDLKPANVRVTPEGKVKVLDFGLARVAEGNGVAEASSTSRAPSSVTTVQGVILGTPAYMSPEQARGEPVTTATDIWAFGCVLYEMLTGKSPCKVEDSAGPPVVESHGVPYWYRLPPCAPPKIRDLLRRCLQNDKLQRMQAAGDIRLEISEALDTPNDATPAQTASAPGSKRLLGVAAGLAVLMAVALLGWWRTTRSRPQELRPLVRLEVDMGPDVSLGSSAAGTDVVISPGGTRLVYVSHGMLFSRRLDESGTTELAGTQGGYAPFFSPDGQWVAFFAQTKLKKVSVRGGEPVNLCDAGIGRGGSWGQDGNIVAALAFNSGLSLVPSNGGTPQVLTELNRARGEVTHRWPQILPGGKAVLFTSHTAPNSFDGAQIDVLSFADHHVTTLVRGGTFGRYLLSGQLVYVNRGTLFAVPFDLDRLELTGTPVPVLEHISYSTTSGSAQLDFSRTGTLVYQSEEGGSRLDTVQWLDAQGNARPLLAEPGLYTRPILSPDGKQLAIQVNQDIWVYDLRRGTMTRLTFAASGEAESVYPMWTPDSRYILFEAPGGMFWIRSDGSGKPQPLTRSKFAQFPWSITADGRRLAFLELNPEGGSDLWTIPLENDAEGLRAGKPELFLHTSFDNEDPSFSPNGHWLAYFSNETGTFQIYVRSFPGNGGKWQISNNGGVYPVWSRNAPELYFRTEDNRIMVASYNVKDGIFMADKPRPWNEKKIADVGLEPNYDLAPDGNRIVALMPAESRREQGAQNQVIFMMNFFDELRRRVPKTKR